MAVSDSLILPLSCQYPITNFVFKQPPVESAIFLRFCWSCWIISSKLVRCCAGVSGSTVTCRNRHISILQCVTRHGQGPPNYCTGLRGSLLLYYLMAAILCLSVRVSYSRCFMRLRKINDGWTKMDRRRSYLALSFVDGAYKQKKIDTCHTLLCTYNTIWLVDCILDWCLSSVKVLRNCALVVFYVLSDNHHFDVVRSKRSENINYVPKLA